MISPSAPITITNKGVPHVFEHAALSGSESYPDPQLFFNMMSNTCQTYLNAETLVNATHYPCASISDKQLLKFADVYLAGVFEPLVLTDAHAMQREAYRYVLDSVDGTLQLTGTVYSEMLGNYYASETTYALRGQLFPGSWYATCTGGQPGVIETMTQQDLIDFHDTFYQPSNSLLTLYGDLCLDDFLAVTAGYYDRYEKTEVSAEDPNYEPFTGYSEVTAEIAVSADTAASTDLYYAIPVRGLSDDDLYLVSSFLATAFNSTESALSRQMMSSYPSATFGVTMTTDGAEPMIAFALIGAGETTPAEFSAAVQEGLRAVLDEGLVYDVLRSSLKSIRRGIAMTRENTNVGVKFAKSVLMAYAMNGEADRYFRNIDALEDCESWFESGTMETVIREQLIDPADSRVVSIVKVPGRQEEETAARVQALADRQAAMTEEELAQAVADTQEYTAWTESLNEISMINEVNVLTVEELPEEVHTPEVTVTNTNAVRYVTSELENNDLVTMTLYFRADWIPAEELQRYGQLQYTLGTVRTGSHTAGEITTMKAAYGISFTPSYFTDGADSGAYTPVLAVSITCLKEDVADAVALVREIMTDSRFDEFDSIRYESAATAYNMKVIIPQSIPHYLIRGLAQAALGGTGLYSYYVGDMPTFRYLESVGDMDDETLQTEADAWAELVKGLYNSEGLQVTVVADAEGIAASEEQVNALAADMPYSVRTAVDYDATLEKLPARIGVKITGSTNYNVKQILLSESGYTDSPELGILSSLVYDQILVPTMRYRNGVYSPVARIEDNTVEILAYRDPDITTTYEQVIPSLAAQVAAMTIDDATLNNLIVSSYTALAKQSGPITEAGKAVMDVLNNTRTQQQKLSRMYAYKHMTADSLKACAGLYDVLSENGVTVTAGPASVIDANADQFDLIISWYIE